MLEADIKTTGQYKIDQHDLPAQQLSDQLRQSLPETLGSGHSAVFPLDADLSFIETRYRPNRDLAVSTRIEGQEPRLVVTLGMRGRSRFVERDGTEIVFSEGYTSITAFNASTGERQYQADREMWQLRFSLTKTWLDQYIGDKASADLFKSGSINLLSHKPISSMALIAAEQLVSCTISASLKPMFMRGQAMSILASELNHLWQNSRHYRSGFTEKDRAMAYAARAILIQ